MSASSTRSPLSIREVKALAKSSDTEGKPHELAQFFTGAKSLDDAGADAFTKGSSKVNYAAQLAGATLEWIWTGNNAGVRHLRVQSDPSLKTVRAVRSRVALAYVEGLKPSSETFPTLPDVDARLNDLWAEFLAILVPEVTQRAKAVNWKQECMNARAERDAAIEETAKLRAALDKALTKVNHLQTLSATKGTATA